MENSDRTGFEKFNFNKQLTEAIKLQNWTQPTPIQDKAIPLAKAGKDILGIAQTGTGKTGAFLLPLMSKLHYPQGEHTRALVLAPTKELITQISIHFQALNTEIKFRSVVLVGGIGISQQLKDLKAGNDIVFATPGRFLEMYQTNEWKLKEIKTLVIDEADRMMDMGFMPQIRKILEVIPSKRQNLLFSATFSGIVEELAAEFLEFPERVEATEQATVATTIDQKIYRTPNFQTKLNLLLDQLKQLPEEESAMVFVKTKKHATDISKFLDRKLPFPVSFLHANKGTNTRIAALNALHTKEVRVLVSTDVAARGLDISSVGFVVNFDLPIKYEEYVHRIGRTGRANRLGKAISFVDPSEEIHLERIEKMIRMGISVALVPEKLLVTDTPYEESQEILKKLDNQKKKADPEFKGAFHEKKLKNQKGLILKGTQPKPVGQKTSTPKTKSIAPGKSQDARKKKDTKFKPKVFARPKRTRG